MEYASDFRWHYIPRKRGGAIGRWGRLLKLSGLVEESSAGKAYTCGIFAPAHGKRELFSTLPRL
jgi:hypothetical protein